MDTNKGFKDNIVRLVALLGLLLVLLLGAWGIILLAFNLPSIASTVGSSIVSLFDYSPASDTPKETETPQTPVAATPAAKPVAKPTGTTSYVPTQTYVPAASKVALYGAADLSVRILSINPLSAGRTSVQFEVMNIGTNNAPAGWTFDAVLPLGYAYTYNSPAQQALYPGDKIVYTLGFNSANQNQYCLPAYAGTMQYPNYNLPAQAGCPPTYGQPQPYPTYPYQTTCYTYNGYQNIPGPCVNSDGYQTSYIPQVYNYNRMVTITVDPRNYIYDFNRTNNIASI